MGILFQILLCAANFAFAVMNYQNEAYFPAMGNTFVAGFALALAVAMIIEHQRR